MIHIYSLTVHQMCQTMILMFMFECLLCADLICSIKTKKFAAAESNEISVFLDRAFVRLEGWFKWYNTTQLGKYICLH